MDEQAVAPEALDQALYRGVGGIEESGNLSVTGATDFGSEDEFEPLGVA
jgi:hypothetical protein